MYPSQHNTYDDINELKKELDLAEGIRNERERKEAEKERKEEE